MPTAFVLMSIEMESEREVVKTLKKIGAVEEVYMLYGTYDMIAKIKTANMDKLKEIVIQIRLLGKVRQTQTMVVMSETE